MNKKLLLSTAALTLCGPLAALADEPAGPTVWDGFSGFFAPDWSRDFNATVGVKIWVSDWSRDSFIEGSTPFPTTDGFGRATSTDSAPDNVESDIEAVPIPQISARYKWFVATGSYYSKTEFQFDRFQATNQAEVFANLGGNPADPADDVLVGRGTTTGLFEQDGDRYEWDASGGIYIHPYVAILGGYKKVRQEIDTVITTTTRLESAFVPDPIDTSSVVTAFSDFDIEGPTIGIAGSVPIGAGFGMYASYAHGFMDAEIRDVTRTVDGIDCSPSSDCDLRDRDNDATYDVAELGFSYTHGMQALAAHMPLSAATVYAGYRYQSISTEFNELVQDRSDVTKGFAVGVNLTF